MTARLVTHSPKAFSHYREQLSLSREMLAKKTSIPLEKISKAEEKESNRIFTFLQLKKIANVLLVPEFYLMSDTLQTPDIPHLIDHRNHTEIDNDEIKYQLNKVTREVVKSREDLLYTYECLDVEPSKFELRLQGNNSQKDALAIRDFLQISEAKFRVDGSDDYYKSWRTLVERKDILVLEISRQKIGSEGMALYYPTLPIIAILSSGQSNSRKLFTMIHELVHLGLRESSIDGELLNSCQQIEQYCNRVAGYVLVPESELERYYEADNSLEDNIDNIRRVLKVSKQAIAIQLKLTGRISQQELSDYLDHLNDKNSSGFGKSGSQYTAVNKFGKVYLQQIISAVWDSNLSMNTAMEMLDLNSVEQLSYLEQKVFG